MNQRKALVDATHRLSIRRQADLLCVNRSSLYYTPAGESAQNLHLMQMMDRSFTEDPTLGVLGMRVDLAELGVGDNSKRIRRSPRKMGIEPIYPKKNPHRLG